MSAIDMIVDLITMTCFVYIGILIYFYIVDGGFKKWGQK